jgi:uncharacterized HAD superfamily protein
LSKILRIGFDIDGVLCSFIPECLEASKKMGLVPENTTINEIRYDIRKQFCLDYDLFDRIILTDDFYFSLPPNMEIINDIRNWLNDGHYIIFITSRPDKNRDITEKWLNKYDIFNKSAGLLHESSAYKYKKAKEHNLNIFIDDYPKVIESMINVLNNPFLLEGPCNHGQLKLYRNSWENIRRKILNL